MNDLEYNNAIKMIDKLYKKLYLSDEVLHHVKDEYAKYDNIKSYIDKLDMIHKRIKDKPYLIDTLKRFYYDKYVIKPENISKINGKKSNDDDIFIRIYKDQIINDQRKSIDAWIDYFLSDETLNIPMWAKFWSFQGMLRLGTYNKISLEFNKREKSNNNVFAELNKEALNLSIDYLRKVLNKESIEDKDLEKIVKSGSFKKIYELMLRRVNKKTADIYDGIWFKYKQGSDFDKMMSSIQGFNTEWCITGYATAKKQLSEGDFYIYYTKDKDGNYKVPRLAIRMYNDNIIREICGVADKQNIEENFEQVIKDKISSFKDKDEFSYGISELEFLSYIHKKWLKKKDLSKDELMFLYEINRNFIGVVPKKDPRINEILNTRDKRCDLALIFDCREDQIALNEDELFVNPDDIICLYDNLTVYDDDILFTNLKYIKGNVNADDLRYATCFKSLMRIGGDAKFDSLIDAKDLKNLISIGGDANFNSLKYSIGFEGLVSIGKSAYFSELLDTIGFVNLKSIGLNTFFPTYSICYMPNVESVKGLENLIIIKGCAYFYSLKSLEYFKSLSIIKDEAHFSQLDSIEGLDRISIEKVGGKLYLSKSLEEEWINHNESKMHK